MPKIIEKTQYFVEGIDAVFDSREDAIGYVNKQRFQADHMQGILTFTTAHQLHQFLTEKQDAIEDLMNWDITPR